VDGQHSVDVAKQDVREIAIPHHRQLCTICDRFCKACCGLSKVLHDAVEAKRLLLCVPKHGEAQRVLQ